MQSKEDSKCAGNCQINMRISLLECFFMFNLSSKSRASTSFGFRVMNNLWIKDLMKWAWPKLVKGVSTKCQKLFLFLKNLLNCVPCVLKTCSRANVPHVLTCQRALRAYVFTCQRVLRAYVLCILTCSRTSVPYVFMCSRANLPGVLTCQRALPAYVSTVLRA